MRRFKSFSAHTSYKLEEEMNAWIQAEGICVEGVYYSTTKVAEGVHYRNAIVQHSVLVLYHKIEEQ